MQAKNYEILMDINYGILNNEIMEIVTGDFGMNHFKIKLLKMKRIPYDLKNTKVRIMVRTPSGSEQQQDCTVEDPVGGTASITFMQSLFTENGMHIAELQIYDSITQVVRLTTPRFSYYVRQSLQGDESIVASDEFSLLQDALASVGDINQQLNNTATDLISFKLEKDTYAEYRISNNQTIPNNIITPVNFDLVSSSSDYCERTDGKVKILKKGVYLITFQLYYSVNNVGYRGARLHKNVSTVLRTFFTSSAPNTSSSSVAGVVLAKLEVGDIVEVQSSQGSGVSLDVVTGTNTHIGIYKLS